MDLEKLLGMKFYEFGEEEVIADGLRGWNIEINVNSEAFVPLYYFIAKDKLTLDEWNKSEISVFLVLGKFIDFISKNILKGHDGSYDEFLEEFSLNLKKDESKFLPELKKLFSLNEFIKLKNVLILFRLNNSIEIPKYLKRKSNIPINKEWFSPDLIMQTKFGLILGDIKYSKKDPKEFYEYAAAYSLLYESLTEFPVNYFILILITKDVIKIAIFHINNKIRSKVIEMIRNYLEI